MGGSSSSGFWGSGGVWSWVGTSTGAPVESLLVPVVGSVGLGTGGISSGGAGASPSACWGGSPVSPFDLLVPAFPCVAPSL